MEHATRAGSHSVTLHPECAQTAWSVELLLPVQPTAWKHRLDNRKHKTQHRTAASTKRTAPADNVLAPSTSWHLLSLYSQGTQVSLLSSVRLRKGERGSKVPFLQFLCGPGQQGVNMLHGLRQTRAGLPTHPAIAEPPFFQCPWGHRVRGAAVQWVLSSAQQFPWVPVSTSTNQALTQTQPPGLLPSQ